MTPAGYSVGRALVAASVPDVAVENDVSLDVLSGGATLFRGGRVVEVRSTKCPSSCAPYPGPDCQPVLFKSAQDQTQAVSRRTRSEPSGGSQGQGRRSTVRQVGVHETSGLAKGHPGGVEEDPQTPGCEVMFHR